MRIAIFGLGYVGAVSGACFSELGHDVVGVDVSAEKVAMINRGEAPILEEMIGELTSFAVRNERLRATTEAEAAVSVTDVSLVSVGTPTAREGGADLSAVERVIEVIGSALKGGDRQHTVIVRSTIPPGTTANRLAPILEKAAGEKLGQRIHLAFNPEFMREGRSVRDFRNPPFTIIGAMSDGAYAATAALYEGIPAEVIRTDPSTAESIKLLSNAWHGLKVAFANETARLLKLSGVDSRTALEIFAKDDVLNISPAYLRPGFAFGGSCLPKDLRALIAIAEKSRTPAPILSAAISSNLAHIDAAVAAIQSCGRRPVALFGLAFKPGTDDLRESPFVTLAERLIGKGFPVTIVDPYVDASRLQGKNKAYIEHEIPHFVELMSRDAASAVETAEIIVFGHASKADKAAILEYGAGKILIDLSGDRELEASGADYRGLAW